MDTGTAPLTHSVPAGAFLPQPHLYAPIAAGAFDVEITFLRTLDAILDTGQRVTAGRTVVIPVYYSATQGQTDTRRRPPRNSCNLRDFCTPDLSYLRRFPNVHIFSCISKSLHILAFLHSLHSYDSIFLSLLPDTTVLPRRLHNKNNL